MENKENQSTNPVDAIVNDLNQFILGGLESTEVQFEEGHEILLEEINFFKDKVETFKSLEDYADKKQYPSIKTLIDKSDNKKTIQPTEVQLEEMNSKLIDGAVGGGIPHTFFQRHGYPSTKTQMSDLDKEMLNKA